MEKNLSIEELALLVNQKLSLNVQSNDKRYSTELTPRRIRDYVSQGLLDKPFKKGKHIYFTEMHLNKLIALRTMQSEGLSDKYLKKLSSLSDVIVEDNQKKLQAFSIIQEIENRVNNSTMSNENNFLKSAQQVINSDNSKLLMTLTKPISKTWEEFTLDNEGKYILKVESGSSIKDKQQILEAIKNILNL